MTENAPKGHPLIRLRHLLPRARGRRLSNESLFESPAFLSPGSLFESLLPPQGEKVPKADEGVS